MKFFTSVLALLVLPVLPAAASVVALDMTVNGGTTPVVVSPGDVITVRLYATVTDNTYVPTGPLGLASYANDILTTGGFLRPVPNLFTPSNWNTVFDPRFGIKAPGNVTNTGNLDDVLGNGATVGVIDYPNNTDIGVLPTLLVTGQFTAVAPGTTNLNSTNVSALVISYNGSSFQSIAPSTLLSSSGIQVTVVPEPASLALLGLGAVGLLSRSQRGRRQE